MFIKVKVQLLRGYYEKMRLDKVGLAEVDSIKLQFAAMIDFLKKL